MIEKFKYDPDSSSWTWKAAQHTDIPDIVRMAHQQFELEIDTIFTPDQYYYASKLDEAVIQQAYYFNKELLIVCRDKTTNDLLAYSWVGRGTYMPFAHQEMAEVKFAHCDLDLPVRQRITLLAQMITHWINWTKACGITILVSSSIRGEQKAFMKLHEEMGFSVRGSVAYLSLKGETK